MKEARENFVKEELMASAEKAQKLVKLVMADGDSVGRGLLASAFAYVILAKSAPIDIPKEDLHEILDMAYRMVQEAEGEGRVLQ